MQTLFGYIGTAASLHLVGVPLDQGHLTSPEVVRRCKAAYASMKSYEGTSNVLTATKMRGAVSNFKLRATIHFVRPAKLRVEGSLSEGGSYIIASDGQQTWEASSRNRWTWVNVKNIDIATAHWAGGSQSASTTIPSILMNASWGNPLAASVNNTLPVLEVAEGKPTYRVYVDEASGQTALWIDQKSFLLVKLKRQFALSQIPIPGRRSKPGEGTDGGAMSITETYSDIHVNRAIVGHTFAPRPITAQPRTHPNR